MKNWKTTISGLVSAGASYVVLNPSCCNNTIHQIAIFVTMGGLAALGVFGKDATTHSTLADVEKATPDVAPLPPPWRPPAHPPAQDK